ncbi:hypothetical protein TRVA0_011S01398 [Trichomonascus vanleenenianus]|uniref:Cin5p n=1 Tax=Trichomonascus vanleenenianus TaxID=2268995 RepID=UPI003EC9A010
METTNQYWSGENAKVEMSENGATIDPQFDTPNQQDNFDEIRAAQAAAAAVAAADKSSLKSEAAVADAMRGVDPDAENKESDMVSRQGRLLSQSKRAKQNRAAQRAFRQRKEVYIKDLEAKVQELQQSKAVIEALEKENRELRDYIMALQSKLLEHPATSGGVPTPPAVYQRAQAALEGKVDKALEGK